MASASAARTSPKCFGGRLIGNVQEKMSKEMSKDRELWKKDWIASVGLPNTFSVYTFIIYRCFIRGRLSSSISPQTQTCLTSPSRPGKFSVFPFAFPSLFVGHRFPCWPHFSLKKWKYLAKSLEVRNNMPKFAKRNPPRVENTEARPPLKRWACFLRTKPCLPTSAAHPFPMVL